MKKEIIAFTRTPKHTLTHARNRETEEEKKKNTRKEEFNEKQLFRFFFALISLYSGHLPYVIAKPSPNRPIKTKKFGQERNENRETNRFYPK